MPKLSVYLPDELAERVRDAKLPVSAICQAALGEALRQAALAVDPFVDPDAALPPDFEIEGVMVRHFGAAVHLAYESAARQGSATVETEDLLRGLLDEGENLMLQTLQAIDVDPAGLTAALDELDTPREPLAAGASPVLSVRARRVARQTDDEAKRRGQPVNLAHLLFALLDDVDGGAGQVLRRAGLDMATARQAVAAMESGVLFGRNATSGLAAARTEALLGEVLHRLGRIEDQLRG